MRPALPANAWLRYDAVREVLRRLGSPGASALELGCGLGSMGARLQARFREYVAVEPDAASREVARRRLAHVVADLSDVPAHLGFDVVFAFEVLEHLEDDGAALAAWVDRARPGGAAIVSVPGDPARWGAWDEHAGHLRRYPPEDLRRLLAGAGLVDVEVIGYGGPLGYALEAGRDAVAARLASRGDGPAERTAASGRQLQPPAVLGPLVAAGTGPFRRLQRVRPPAGPGLVGWGRRPGAGP